MVMMPSLAGATQWMQLDHDNSGLPNNRVRAIETTDTGVWVGTEGGLAHYDGSVWRSYTETDSFLPDNKVNDVHVDASGTVWVATYSGLAVYRNRMWEVLDHQNSQLPTDLVRCLASDADGDLWAGTWGSGLVRLGHSGSEVFNAQNSGLASNGIYAVFVDRDGRLWAGTHGGGVSLYENGYWTTFTTSNSGLPHDNVISIGQGADGDLWFGTHNGLARLHMDGEVNWQVYSSIYFDHAVQVFSDIATDANGVMWFATDGGLLRYDGAFQFLWSSNSGLVSNSCSAVDVDDRGNVFVGHTDQGISIYNEDGIALNVAPVRTQLDFELFPNPTTDGITVKIPVKGDGQYNVTVTDLTGRTVVNRSVQSSFDGETLRQTVDVSALPTGTYVLTVRSASDIASAPFMKR